MAAEIELKLSLSQQSQNSLKQHPLLRSCQRQAPQQRTLYNRYFDTPERALNQHKVALRIRRQGSDYIQTLKTRGNSEGGLHQRQEWEWTLHSDHLAPQLLPADALPAGLDPSLLQPIFTTDFERTTWLLDYPHRSGSACIELVLDQGWVSSGELRDPIHEIELELKGGAAEALIDFARELACQIPLRICRISKAERGFRLTQPLRARWLPEITAPAPQAAAAEAFYHLCGQLTERLQICMEGFEFLHEPPQLLPLYEDLEQLQLLLQGGSPQLPSEVQGLPQQLGDLLDTLRPLLATLLLQQRWGTDFGAAHGDTATAETLNPWLEQLELGQVLLDLSALLYHRPWQASLAMG